MSRAKYVERPSRVTWDPKAQYPLYYVPAFPLALLRYRDLEEKDPLGHDWRSALMADIQARGLKCPLLVCNHQSMRNAGGSLLYPDLAMLLNKPWHLRVGRNRRWALEKLQAKTAPCIVTGHIDALDVEAELITTPERLLELWPDGHMSVDRDMVHVYGKCDPTAYEYPA